MSRELREGEFLTKKAVNRLQTKHGREPGMEGAISCRHGRRSFFPVCFLGWAPSIHESTRDALDVNSSRALSIEFNRAVVMRGAEARAS